MLAPAGTPEAFAAALHAGADAVYVGLKGWSRGGARNEMSDAQLRDAIGYAHRLHRQVHLAANVIPLPPQKPALLAELRALADCGLDGVIVNDAGFLRDIRVAAPDLPVTVSIGCGALNADDVLFYEALGAASVVLPGNLEPHEIAAIRERTPMQLEIMLHMVEEFLQLGKCWMPSYHNFHAAAALETARLTGSVKRGGVGACFKICQNPWDVLLDDKVVDTRVFPRRQISRLRDLSEYLEAGVDIVKLQGRSLSAEQLVTLVDQYRSAIDAWQEGRPYAGTTIPLPVMWTVKGR